jgi:hypothetical protein
MSLYAVVLTVGQLTVDEINRGWSQESLPAVAHLPPRQARVNS